MDALISSPLPAVDGPYPIETWYRAEDGDDYAPAWDRAMGQGDGLVAPISDSPNGGGAIAFGSREYRFSRAMDVTRPTTVSGAGKKTTVLRFAGAGVVIWFPNQYPGRPRPGYSGSETVLRDLAIVGPGKSAQGGYHGIDMQIRAHVEHCSVAYFPGHGINIRGDVNLEHPTGCNTATFADVRSIGHGGAGYYLVGGDANANTFTACDATDCVLAGFLDESFLGNTYVGCHVNLHPQPPGSGSYPPGYVSRRPSQASAFIGCYQEGANASEINAPSYVVGGRITIKPGFTACHLRGLTSGMFFPRGFTAAGLPDADGATAEMLSGAAAVAPWSIKSSRDTYPYGWQRTADGWWRLMRGWVTSLVALRGDNKSQTPAELWFPSGFTLGHVANRRKVNVCTVISGANVPPSDVDGTVGDVVMAAIPDQTLDGWRKRQTPEGPRWVPFVLPSPPQE